MNRLLAIVAAAVTSAAAHHASATLIVGGDVTANLDGTLFLDAASTGGSDATQTAPGFFNPQRVFDLNGSAGAPGVPGLMTVQGFGFATPNSFNTATTVALTFIYLGANQAVGGGDDLVIGSETVDWASGWSGSGEYYVNFDSDPSLLIDGLGERFRITITPMDGSIRLKQATAGLKLSVSGTFAAVPEPTPPLLFGLTAVAMGLTAYRRCPRPNV